LVVGFPQTVVAALADGAIAGQWLGYRPAGDGEGEAGVGARKRV
jgi:hypothetical protein